MSNSGYHSPKKDTYKQLSHINTEQSAAQYGNNSNQDNLSPHSEVITIVVMPCGREDGKNSNDEMPYEFKIRKKGRFNEFIIYYNTANENSLKDIFLRKPSYWEKIYKPHLEYESQPNFAIYRKPFEVEQDPSKSDLCKFCSYL